ncbi:MAG: hypothetical protein ACLUD7_03705 [Lachnospiraceae bacterium]
MLQRIKNKKIKTKNLFIVPVGYNKIYGTGKEIQDYSFFTGKTYHREVKTYRFIPINPIYNICVKKDDERDLWVDIITGNEYQMFDINLEDSAICVSNRIIPVSKYFLEEKVSFEDLKELILKLNETENKKMTMKEYVENFEEFIKTNPEETKQIALEALIATGVLDENGNAKKQIVTSSQYIGKEEKAPTKTLTKPKKNNK